MSDLQFNNPDAPNYDWQKDREWFNQRLANARLENYTLRNRLSSLRGAVKDIAAGNMTKPSMRDLAKEAISKDNDKRATQGKTEG